MWKLNVSVVSCAAIIRVNIIVMVMKMIDLQLLMLTTLNYTILAPTMTLISTLQYSQLAPALTDAANSAVFLETSRFMHTLTYRDAKMSSFFSHDINVTLRQFLPSSPLPLFRIFSSSTRLMPSSYYQHGQDETVLFCRWCEQNWRQVKTVFSSPHRISRLDKTVSNMTTAVIIILKYMVIDFVWIICRAAF